VLILVVTGLVTVPERGDAQQSYTIRDAVFLPQVFYVGDRVELRLRLRVDPGVTVRRELAPPDVEWGRVHSISAAQQGRDAEVRVEFTAFRQGTLALPPINVGDITVQGFDIYVETILGDDREPAPLRDQTLLPSTNLLIAGGLGAVVLLPLVWVLFVRVGRSRIRRMVERYRANQPARRLRKSIRQLRAEVEETKGRDFYIRLLSDLRSYMSRKLGVDCMSATTEELRGYLVQLIDQADDREALLDLFHYGDRVKFARGSSTVKMRRRHLDTVSDVLEEVEERHTRHRERQVRERRRREHRRKERHVGVS
jgi:hypothetical protein